MNQLFVGGLAWATDDAALTDFFAQVGEVRSLTIVMDRDTGRSRGFGFVEMADANAAREAIERLDGATLDGRRLVVNTARPRSTGVYEGYRDRDREGPRVERPSAPDLRADGA